MITKALKALTTEEELWEVMMIGTTVKPEVGQKLEDVQLKRTFNDAPVLLRRTFNQSDFQGGYIKFWRIIGPLSHPNLNSDLSLQGLKEWGIL